MNLKEAMKNEKSIEECIQIKKVLSLIQNFTSVSIAKELTLKNIELETSLYVNIKEKKLI